MMIISCSSYTPFICYFVINYNIIAVPVTCVWLLYPTLCYSPAMSVTSAYSKTYCRFSCPLKAVFTSLNYPSFIQTVVQVMWAVEHCDWGEKPTFQQNAVCILWFAMLELTVPTKQHEFRYVFEGNTPDDKVIVRWLYSSFMKIVSVDKKKLKWYSKSEDCVECILHCFLWSPKEYNEMCKFGASEP